MKGSPTRSAFCSILIHAAAIALILLCTAGPNPPIALMRPMLLAARDLVYLPPAPDRGGGGGQNQPAPPHLGPLPRPAPRVFTPPMVEIRNVDPKLPIEPTILAPTDTVMPVVNVEQWGDPAGILWDQVRRARHEWRHWYWQRGRRRSGPWAWRRHREQRRRGRN